MELYYEDENIVNTEELDLFWPVPRDCVTCLFSSHAQPSFMRHKHTHFLPVPRIRAVGEKKRLSVCFSFFIFMYCWLCLFLSSCCLLTDRTPRTGAEMSVTEVDGTPLPFPMWCWMSPVNAVFYAFWHQHKVGEARKQNGNVTTMC